MAKSQVALARELLVMEREVAPTLLKIADHKQALRDISEAKGEGFTEEIEGLGSVEVKAGAEKKFKGLVPQLVPDAFLALSPARQQKLLGDELVVMEAQYTSARSASVTVRL